MADAPRSILAWLGGPHQGLSFAGGPSGKEIEYIRADVARADAELAVAEVQRLRGTDETCAKCDAKGEDCGEHVPTWADLAAVWKARAEKAEAERDALRAALERCPPTSNPTLSAEYNLECIEAWWRLEVRPVLAKP